MSLHDWGSFLCGGIAIGMWSYFIGYRNGRSSVVSSDEPK